MKVSNVFKYHKKTKKMSNTPQRQIYLLNVFLGLLDTCRAEEDKYLLNSGCRSMLTILFKYIIHYTAAGSTS